LRNALTTRIVDKLVFIKSNLSTFYNYLAPDNDIVEYSSESDDNAAAALGENLVPKHYHPYEKDIVKKNANYFYFKESYCHSTCHLF
jgi:hypothetical protein